MSDINYGLKICERSTDKDDARGVNQFSDYLSLQMAICVIVIFKLLLDFSLSVPPVSAVPCYPKAEQHANAPWCAKRGQNHLHMPCFTGGDKTSEKQHEW